MFMSLLALPFLFSIFVGVGWNSISNLSTGVVALDNDDLTDFSGQGDAWVSDDKRLILTGDAPRFRILHDYENVNVTLFAKRVSEEKELDYQGIVVGARSQHYDDSACGANTYYARLTNNGKVSFEKELFHGEGRNAFYPNQDKVIFSDGVPRDKWIGFQFIVKTLANGNVNLQLILDYDGEWSKVLEYTDKGNWPVQDLTQDQVDKLCDGHYPINKIIQAPGFVFIRNDGLGDDGRSEYKGISIQELN